MFATSVCSRSVGLALIDRNNHIYVVIELQTEREGITQTRQITAILRFGACVSTMTRYYVLAGRSLNV